MWFSCNVDNFVVIVVDSWSSTKILTFVKTTKQDPPHVCTRYCINISFKCLSCFLLSLYFLPYLFIYFFTYLLPYSFTS